MREQEFLSQNTRRASISMVVYNNALPMYCFLKLTFDVTQVGQISSFFSVEAMNIQEYLSDTWLVQATLEVVLLLWTLSHVCKECVDVCHSCRVNGCLNGLAAYISNGWVILDWMRTVALLLGLSLWIMLLADQSRDIDLDTTDFIDLEDIATTFRFYNLLYNVIILGECHPVRRSRSLKRAKHSHHVFGTCLSQPRSSPRCSTQALTTAWRCSPTRSTIASLICSRSRSSSSCL